MFGTKEAALFKRIMIVCIGNICRSPTAEHLMRVALAPSDIVVSSAGLSAVKRKPIEATAAAVLEEHGHVLPEHSGTQLTAAAISDSYKSFFAGFGYWLHAEKPGLEPSKFWMRNRFEARKN